MLSIIVHQSDWLTLIDNMMTNFSGIRDRDNENECAYALMTATPKLSGFLKGSSKQKKAQIQN